MNLIGSLRLRMAAYGATSPLTMASAKVGFTIPKPVGAEVKKFGGLLSPTRNQ